MQVGGQMGEQGWFCPCLVPEQAGEVMLGSAVGLAGDSGGQKPGVPGGGGPAASTPAHSAPTLQPCRKSGQEWT